MSARNTGKACCLSWFNNRPLSFGLLCHSSKGQIGGNTMKQNRFYTRIWLYYNRSKQFEGVEWLKGTSGKVLVKRIRW